MRSREDGVKVKWSKGFTHVVGETTWKLLKDRTGSASVTHLFVVATEAEALWNQRVDLPLPVLLTNALIGRQPRQSLTQVVVIWLSNYKQSSRKLDIWYNRWYMKLLAAAQAVFQMFAEIRSPQLESLILFFTCGPTAPWFMAALCSLRATPIKECLLW